MLLLLTGDHYFPAFPNLYEPYKEDRYGFNSGPSTHFDYDKSSPFDKSPFPSMYKKPAYSPPKFDFGYRKKRRDYDGDMEGEYDSSSSSESKEDDMYGEDRAYFLKRK